MLKELFAMVEMIKARALIRETIGNVNYICVDEKYDAEHIVIVAEKDGLHTVYEWDKAHMPTDSEQKVLCAIDVWWDALIEDEGIDYWLANSENMHEAYDEDDEYVCDMDDFCKRLAYEI